jgi:hypothetical protein
MRKVVPFGVVLCLVIGLSWTVIQALPTPSQFELEGNAVVDALPPNTTADDWANTVPPPPGATSEALASVFIADGAGNATIFTTGGSKDINDVSQWRHKNDAGGLPDKDNLTNAYAAAYQNNGDLTFYFGADRFANDGDAQMGFWFFKTQVQVGANGRFVGADGVTPATHSIGDVLVLVNISNGGAVAKAAAFRWVGGANPLQPFAVELDNARCGTNTDPDLCVISNDDPETAPWAYQPKQGPAGTFPTFSFIEGGVNITLLGGAAGAGCFSSFLAETRSSTSESSTLKDFALGEFNTCDIDIAKTCPSAVFNPATGNIDYTSEITVTNSGFGTVFDVTVIDTPSSLPPTTLTLDSLAAGASHTFSHTFSLTPGPATPNPPSNEASVTAAVVDNGPQIIDGGDASATCPQVSFDANLTITKTCEAGLEVQNDRIVVVVAIAGEVCNVAPAPGGAFPESIVNVAVNDTPPVEGQPLSLGTLLSGECKTYQSKYYPALLSNPNGHAGDQSFLDTAVVTGTGAISGNARTNTASATCPLCF